MYLNEVLQAVEKKLGAPPRRFSLLDKWRWMKQDKPGWDWENDDIKHSVLNWKKVFVEGKLSWGHIVQVNTLLFEKSNANCPGDVLIWMDDPYSFDLEAMASVAEQLFELKGYSDYLDEKEEKTFAGHLENELTRAYGIRVPGRIANNLNLRLTTVFFQRRHIPGGIINTSFFPVLYLASAPMVTVMVPSFFWPKDFTEKW